MMAPGKQHGEPLAGEENVLRHVGPSKYDRDAPLPSAIDGSAFDRNAKDYDGLSVDRRGVFSKDVATDIQHIRKIMESRRNVSQNSVFAELNVDRCLAALARFDADVNFLKNPLPADGERLANPAHALITGLPLMGTSVGDLQSELAGDLLRQQIHEVHSLRR